MIFAAVSYIAFRERKVKGRTGVAVVPPPGGPPVPPGT